MTATSVFLKKKTDDGYIEFLAKKGRIKLYKQTNLRAMDNELFIYFIYLYTLF